MALIDFDFKLKFCFHAFILNRPSTSQPVNQWNQQLPEPTQPSPIADPWAVPAPPTASSIPYKQSSAPAPTSDPFAPQSPSLVSGADPFAAQPPFLSTPAADPFAAQSTLVSPAPVSDPFAPHSSSQPPSTDISSTVRFYLLLTKNHPLLVHAPILF